MQIGCLCKVVGFCVGCYGRNRGAVFPYGTRLCGISTVVTFEAPHGRGPPVDNEALLRESLHRSLDEMDQIKPGTNYQATADLAFNLPNWEEVVRWVEFFPALQNNGGVISSQESLSCWLFTDLVSQCRLGNQAWIDVRDMNEHRWLDVIYQRSRSDLQRSHSLFSCRNYTTVSLVARLYEIG